MKDDKDSCPKCNSENVNFFFFYIVDTETGYYDAECNDCGFIGRQWYKLEFDRWQEEKHNRDYVDLD